MPFRNLLLNDGNEIPSIAYGTGSARMDHKHVTEYIEQALESGFSHIDTAQHYKTEDSVGRAMRESDLDRSELYITTKYSGVGGIQGAIRDSLGQLGLKYVDLYLIHKPSSVGGEFELSWKEFERIKEDGLAKSIGVSNFSFEQLQTLLKTATIKPAVNQVELHPYTYAQNKALIQYAASNNIIIEAYSSLKPLRLGGPVDKLVNEAAKRRGVQPSQILFAWVKAKGAVIVTTSSKREHIKQALEAADIEPLTDAEIAAIDEAGALGPYMSKKEFMRNAGEQIPVLILAVFSCFAIYSWLH